VTKNRLNHAAALQQESRFHDERAAGTDIERIDVRSHFEASTAPENRFILRHMGDLNGRLLLDVGCGVGQASVYFALKGARCVAVDCSGGMVGVTSALAAKHGVAIEAKQMDAARLEFADDTFDVVYASNLLHHTDAVETLREMHRVVKPGGKVCFWDPLAYNPAINVYRRMAKGVRTVHERPLTARIVRAARSLFRNVTYDTFWLLALWIFVRFYVVEGVHPNAEPYWTKIITDEARLRAIYRTLERLDGYAKRIPFMKWLAWNIAVVATK
jgi:SAM-dependent methyltransferase